MSEKKIFTNPKNLAIATLALAITMGSTIAFLHTFIRGSQFVELETETTSESPSSAVEPEAIPEPPSSIPPRVTIPEFPSSELKPETTSEPQRRVAPSRRPQHYSVPPTDLSHVDEALNNFEWGNIVFNTPRKLRLEEPKIIELVLSPTQSIEELQSSLESQEQISEAEIRISNRMKAELSGTGFKIEALIPQEQAISREQTTRWKWEVTPTQDGSQNLHLTLSAIINVSGQDTPLVIQTFNETIEVEVSMGHHISTFVSDHWEWLWASILVPTAPFLWKLYRKKRGRNLPV